MTVQIDTTAVIKKVRLQQQASHFAGDPEAGYSWLYVVTGSAYGGLYLETDAGSVIGPFVTGTVGTGRVLIGETSPTSTGTSFSSIPSIYNSLEIEYIARSDRASQPLEICYIFFNNDKTAGNYRYTLHSGYGAITSETSAGDNSTIFIIPGSTATANTCGTGKMKIINYASTTFNKQVQVNSSARYDAASYYERYDAIGVEWESTVAINRIDIVTVNGSNFVAGSKFRLYGVY